MHASIHVFNKCSSVEFLSNFPYGRRCYYCPTYIPQHLVTVGPQKCAQREGRPDVWVNTFRSNPQSMLNRAGGWMPRLFPAYMRTGRYLVQSPTAPLWNWALLHTSPYTCLTGFPPFSDSFPIPLPVLPNIPPQILDSVCCGESPALGKV